MEIKHTAFWVFWKFSKKGEKYEATRGNEIVTCSLNQERKDRNLVARNSTNIYLRFHKSFKTLRRTFMSMKLFAQSIVVDNLFSSDPSPFSADERSSFTFPRSNLSSALVPGDTFWTQPILARTLQAPNKWECRD